MGTRGCVARAKVVTRHGVRWPLQLQTYAAPCLQTRSCASSVQRLGLSADMDAALKSCEGVRELKLGHYRACATHEEYAHFMLATYFYYSALERAFAAQPATSAVARVWQKYPVLRGVPRNLGRDLRAVGIDSTSATPSPASAACVAGVDSAGSDELLGHFYARYVYLPAVLDSGFSPRRAVQLALSLPDDRPEFFGFPSEEYESAVSQVRDEIDQEGLRLSPEEQKKALEGAINAVTMGAEAHSERPRLQLGAAFGLARAAGGWLYQRARGGGRAQLAAETVQAQLLPTQAQLLPTSRSA